MKTCNKCGKEKPLDDFYKRRKYSEKRFNTCKSCVIERVQERNALHKAEKSAYDAERYAQDPAPAKARASVWREENPEAGWESYYRVRAKRYGVKPTVEPFTRDELIAAYGNACVDCGNEWSELEHVIPVVAGGAHSLANCRPICTEDNRRRWQEYRKTTTTREK